MMETPFRYVGEGEVGMRERGRRVAGGGRMNECKGGREEGLEFFVKGSKLKRGVELLKWREEEESEGEGEQ